MHLNPYYASLLGFYKDEEDMCEQLGICLTDIYTDEDWV
ncbi:MAG: hypothetical protein K0S30_900 [Clostridia bacterium]|jgi:hypothetical protein|nr:hypothetical protein [Clostridia bacterium]